MFTSFLLAASVSFVGQAPGSSDTQVPRSSDLGTKATMSRLSKQPIAAYGVTERVIAYGQGPPVMVYATAKAFSDFCLQLADMTNAKMSGDDSALAEATSKCKALMQSQSKNKLTGSVPSGTLFEVVSTRWIAYPKRPGVGMRSGGMMTGMNLGQYAYELRCIDPQARNRGKLCWLDEQSLVPATQRLLPPAAPTRIDRAMYLMLYFQAHAPEPLDKDEVSLPAKTESEPTPVEPTRKSSTRVTGAGIEVLDDTMQPSDNTKYGGPFNWVYIRARNVSDHPLKILRIYIHEETKDNSLIAVENTLADPYEEVESGSIFTAKLGIYSPNVDHYSLSFEADGKEVKFSKKSK